MVTVMLNLGITLHALDIFIMTTIMPSVVDTVNRTVRAELDHFSRYCMIAD